MTIKDHIKGMVKFQYYRDNQLFYKTETGLVFPVPIEDIGNATFLAEDKAMLFMRYIRKFLSTLPAKDDHRSGIPVVAVEGFPADKAMLVDPNNPDNRVVITNLETTKK